MLTERIKEIITITKSMEDVDFACWSGVTHIVFEDYNINQHHIESLLHDNKRIKDWKQAIQHHMDKFDHMPIESWLDQLKEIQMVIDALQSLYQYTEQELDFAAMILWTDWDEIESDFGIAEDEIKTWLNKKAPD